MDTKVHISKAELHDAIRQIDARPVPARLRAREAHLIAARLRKAPGPGLRRRISVA
jgi:hypothetical protein